MIRNPIVVTNTRPYHFGAIVNLTRRVYENAAPWIFDQLESHLRHFPEGQFVAVHASGRVVGMAASLIIRWDDYDFRDNWKDFTDAGMFTNHDPVDGQTLYGAEVMVDPDWQGRGVGSLLYNARRQLTERLGLRRIRAAARLRGYHRFSQELTAKEYVCRVVRRELRDPTLSFQLKHGFEVLTVVEHYLHHDPESLGHAALIEWRNPVRDASALQLMRSDGVRFQAVAAGLFTNG
jgi:GNAT superfamily N-acetyltransferase